MPLLVPLNGTFGDGGKNTLFFVTKDNQTQNAVNHAFWRALTTDSCTAEGMGWYESHSMEQLYRLLQLFETERIEGLNAETVLWSVIFTTEIFSYIMGVTKQTTTWKKRKSLTDTGPRNVCSRKQGSIGLKKSLKESATNHIK